MSIPTPPDNAFRATGGPWISCTNFHKPQDLLGCMDKIPMEAKDAAL